MGVWRACRESRRPILGVEEDIVECTGYSFVWKKERRGAMAATFDSTGGMLRLVYCVVSSICLVSRSPRAADGGSDAYPNPPLLSFAEVQALGLHYCALLLSREERSYLSGLVVGTAAEERNTTRLGKQ